LAIGLLGPIVLVGIGRNDAARRRAGQLALPALALVAAWLVVGPMGWLGLLAGLAAIIAVAGLAKEVIA
jgi:hypothetical protein